MLLLELSDRLCALQRETDIIQPFQQTIPAEGIDRK